MMKRFGILLQFSDDNGETWVDARDIPFESGLSYMSGKFDSVREAFEAMVKFSHQSDWLLDGNYAYPNDQTLFKNIRRERWEISEVFNGN